MLCLTRDLENRKKQFRYINLEIYRGFLHNQRTDIRHTEKGGNNICVFY